MDGGVNAFALQVIDDALLVVDASRFLFANNALEELCGSPSNTLLQQPTTFMPDEERLEFFRLVNEHCEEEGDNTDLLSETFVECIHQRAGAFLSKVTFHPYREANSTTFKCVCKFSHPLFYKSMFDRTSSLLAILEYNYANRDCTLMRANTAAETFFGLTENGQQGNLRLARQLGVQFDVADVNYFSHGGSDYPRINSRLCVVKSNDMKSYLSATFTFIGRSLRGRRLFAFVADDVTKLVSAETDAEYSRRLLDSQSAFFAKMVHELRSPLSGMLGMTALLKQETLMTSEQTGMVHTIETCSNTLLSLGSDVLDLSRLERNMVTLTFAPFDVMHCIEEAFAIVSPQAVTKSVDLIYEINFDGHPKLIVGDQLRVRQILINLVSNAIKFTDKPNRVILINATRAVDSDLITFHVEDSGIGIAEHAKAQIFDSFTQATPAINQRFGGTGLGLAIVKALVELMHGTLGVSSEEGVGSRFYFSIPGGGGNVDPAMMAREERDSLAAATRVLSGKTAIVSLSNATSAANLSSRLSALGMQVLSSPERVDITFSENVIANCPANYAIVNWTRPVGWSGHFLRKPIQTQALVECLSHVLHVMPWPTSKLVCPPILSPCTVLVVDDSVVNRKVLVRMLERLGYPPSSILTASDGREALTRLEQQPVVDVILLDVMMPVMSGIDTAREISRRWPKTMPYVIGLTADVTDACKSACLEAGMDGFLSKPLQLESLIRAMSAATTRKASKRSTQARATSVTEGGCAHNG